MSIEGIGPVKTMSCEILARAGNKVRTVWLQSSECGLLWAGDTDRDKTTLVSEGHVLCY